MIKTAYSKGFTLVEIVVALSIFTGLALLLSTFQKDVFVNNIFIQNSLIAESEARGALKRAIAELRAAEPSNNGLYSLAAIDHNAITFFSDIDKDGVRERVRYFMATSSLNRGVIEPSGTPYIYSSANEKISIVVRDIVNPTTTPVFEFYDKTYQGTSTPLSLPTNISNVRLIKMTIMIDANPVRSPTIMTFTSQVMVRNLKDNL